MDVFDIFAKLSIDSSGYEKGLKTAGKSADSFGVMLKKALGTAGKITAAAMGAAATSVVAVASAAVNAYGEFEQLEGGVKKLFGEDAAQAVLKNAQQAYETAGMSTNKYLDTVTSFSAALLNGMKDAENAEEKAAYVADMAVKDMADNANTFGTSIDSIQVAYAGFAKGNFTMLDNLKLGYGGTASEMARLVNESGIMNGEFEATAENVKDIPFDLLVQAIHSVQENMGITGTTAAEASKTIQGSLTAAKAAWENLMLALGSGEGMDEAITALTESAKNVVENIMPVVKTALSGVGDFVKEIGPVMIENLPGLIEELLPELLSAAWSLATSLIEALPSIVDALWETMKTLFTAVVDKIKEIFKFDWEFPKPKMPHFSVSWRDLGIISLPDVSVEWYRKAYDNPYMFTKPTLMGFGDGAGGEMVYGHESLMRDIREASGGGKTYNFTVNISGDISDPREKAEELMYEIKALLDREEAAFAW